MQVRVPVVRSKGESCLGNVFVTFKIPILSLTPTSAFDLNLWIPSSFQRQTKYSYHILIITNNVRNGGYFALGGSLLYGPIICFLTQEELYRYQSVDASAAALSV